MLDAILLPLVWIDVVLALAVPAWAVVALWGLLAGAACMGVYALTSSQESIKAQKAKTAAAKETLAAAADDNPEHWRLAAAALGGSLRVLGLIVFPTLLSIIPVVYVALHVDRAYGTLPAQPGELTLNYQPASARLRVEPPGSGEAARGTGRLNIPENGSVRLLQGDQLLAEVSPEFRQTRLLRELSWMDRLAGATPLPAESEVEELNFGLAPTELITVGPGWTRSWEFIFFSPLVVLALSIRWILGLQ